MKWIPMCILKGVQSPFILYIFTYTCIWNCVHVERSLILLVGERATYFAIVLNVGKVSVKNKPFEWNVKGQSRAHFSRFFRGQGVHFDVGEKKASAEEANFKVFQDFKRFWTEN